MARQLVLWLDCRLLDDNRELYVPELGEMVQPHPHFMLFATQNPAGAYGGRKVHACSGNPRASGLACMPASYCSALQWMTHLTLLCEAVILKHVSMSYIQRDLKAFRILHPAWSRVSMLNTHHACAGIVQGVPLQVSGAARRGHPRR